MNFLSFSDTTIRTTPIAGESNKKLPCGLLFHELLFLVHTQCRLIMDGYLLRGAVTNRCLKPRWIFSCDRFDRNCFVAKMHHDLGGG